MHFRRTWFGLLMAVGVIAPPVTANAEIRQHILHERSLNPEQIMSALNSEMADTGFSTRLNYDQTSSASQSSGEITFRMVEYSFTHVDGRNVTATFFIPTEGEEANQAALLEYISYYYGYSLGNGAYMVKGGIILSWSEWNYGGGGYGGYGGYGYGYVAETLTNSSWAERYLDH